MSGLLERIARHRRATASSRLGPPPSPNGAVHPSPGAYGQSATANGGPAPHDAGVASANGRAPDVTTEERVWLEVVSWRPEAPAPEAVADVVEGQLDDEEAADSAEVAMEPVAEEIAAEEIAAEVVAEEVVAEVAEEAPQVAEVPEAAPAEAEVPGASPEAPLAEAPPAEAPSADAAPAEAEPTAAPAPGPEAPSPEPVPGFIERGRLRRRARYLRRLREIQLRDIGGFLVELHRFDRERPDLVEAKVAGAAGVDSELRALERALGTLEPVREIREAGIGGACSRCGAVHGSGDRFCSSCGAALSGDAQ